MYPQDWVTRYVGKVGKTTMRNAKDLSSAVGPSQPFKRQKEPTEWCKRRLSVTVAAADRKCGAPKCLRLGELVKESIKYRILHWYEGCEKHNKDAKKEDFPVYSHSYFYIRQDKLGLVHPESDAGLCPNCHRYGEETWDDVYQCIELLYQCGNLHMKISRDSVSTFGEVVHFIAH
jgi:hypothetical protein